ncbi:MAG: putative DCC family thiol-disulfide oxidoreductase YuxK [Phenylobacterium sp.]|jgi:predicted DCC family thiol-disulfide oxidoreductase YuxK
MSNQHIIIFDGVCHFCNHAVNFIIKRDHHNIFLFTPMQSESAQAIIRQFKAENVGFDTFLLIKNNQCFYRTDAALEISKDLSGFWFLWRIFTVLPRPIRDYFYRLFARNRYRLFGRSASCMVPTAAVKSKFL